MGGFVLCYGEIVLFGRIYFKERKSLQSNPNISEIRDIKGKVCNFFFMLKYFLLIQLNAEITVCRNYRKDSEL